MASKDWAIAASIALVIAAPWAAGLVFSGMAATMLTAGIIVGGSLLLNRALAPSIEDTDRSGVRVPPQTTQEEGIAVQVVYGRNRCHANIVGSFTVVPARDTVTRGKDVTRRIKGCFGEGPWAAEPDSSSIRINGRPITDFSGLTATWRLGTVNQTVLTGWSTHRQDYHVGQTVLYGSPVTWTLTRAGWDDIEVILEFPNGLIHYGTDGDTHHEEIQVRVEVGDAIADTWQTIVEKTIMGRIAQACYVSFLASETYTGGSAFTVTSTMQPRVRVTALTPDSTNSRHIRNMEVYAAQVHKNTAFRHPGFVVMGLSLVPDQAISGGVSELSCISTGKVVADGSGGFGVTTYASDVIRDILTQPVIEGSGTLADPWRVNYYAGTLPFTAPLPHENPTPEDIAFHEAGHAVAAVLLGMPPFSYTAVIPLDGVSSGGVVWLTDPTPATPIDAQVQMFLSGPAAQVLAMGYLEPVGARRDIHKAAKLLRQSRPDAGLEEISDLVGHLLMNAQEWLWEPSRWMYVCSVAKALLTQQRLTYQQVLDLAP
jgi:hypothetical protein